MITSTILVGDVREKLREMPAESVHCVVTSPPYWGLRDYGVEGQIGLEETPEAWVAAMVETFREVRRVLRDDGTCWVNLGDSYAGNSAVRHDQEEQFRERSDRKGYDPGNAFANYGARMARGGGAGIGDLKPKDLIGQPWMLAFALRADGWYLRSEIIWHKPNPMPESCTDRPTKSHEQLFLLSKSPRYFYDADAVREAAEYGFSPTTRGEGIISPGSVESNGRGSRTVTRGDGGTRNLRDVWTIATHSFPGAHFATFPPKLVEPCIKAGCPQDGTVLDPFCGAGTTGLVAARLGRDFIGIELNPEYAAMARKRIKGDMPLFTEVSL